MKWKSLILPVLLAAGLGAIHFLPQAGKVAGTAIRMDLPDYEGGWEFEKRKPSDEELKALAKDTQFSKAFCIAPRRGEYTLDNRFIYDRLDLSIVLSGYDLNNSIHRPERCMPAQGHVILSSSDVRIFTESGKSFIARRLVSKQRDDNDGKKLMPCVTYYFFVGHNRIEHDHWHRTFIDMKDRLVSGMDQRWAYASVSMWYGRMPWNEAVEIPEREADEKISKFLSKFAEEQINWEQIRP